MIVATPAPKFLLICIVEQLKSMHGTLEVLLSQPCAMGRVEKNASEKFAHVKEGDIVYFHRDNANPVRLDTVRMHAFLYEDAILGTSAAADVGVQPMMLPDHAPNTAILTPKGVKIPIPGSHRVN